MAILVLLSASMTGCGLVSDADEKLYFGEKRQPVELEYQYVALANELQSIKPCYLIHPRSLRAGAFGSVGSQVSLNRSTCFAWVAEGSGNEKPCDKVRSASTLFLSGADLNAETCRRNARVPGMVSLRLDVPEIVALAGYEEEEIDVYLVSEGRFSGIEAAQRYRRDQPSTYWNEVQMTLLHTEQFFDRIGRLPGFGTAEDQATMNALRWEPRQQRLWTLPEQRTRSVPEIRVPAPSERE
ncbi:hypothetical protein [Thioalkalivibrio nitratireducens]|uniref:hypothetical protein n=1 Tax=Thioalkalivibrio nitratireducens TaxID=186931 RepID=UPI0012EE0426|nr:hypothetical protein [Thioalkalivibrio nitratireducens]